MTLISSTYHNTTPGPTSLARGAPRRPRGACAGREGVWESLLLVSICDDGELSMLGRLATRTRHRVTTARLAISASKIIAFANPTP